MELKFSFKNMDTSDALKFFANEKSQKLQKYFQGRLIINWTFSVENERRIAHCHLVGKNMDYFGQAEHDDIHVAIDDALAQIERQVQKHKEIVKDHLHRERA